MVVVVGATVVVVVVGATVVVVVVGATVVVVVVGATVVVVVVGATVVVVVVGATSEENACFTCDAGSYPTLKVQRMYALSIRNVSKRQWHVQM